MKSINLFYAAVACSGLLLSACASSAPNSSAHASEAVASSHGVQPTPGDRNTIPLNLRVLGVEPFWSVMVEEKTLVYKTMEMEKGIELAMGKVTHDAHGMTIQNTTAPSYELIVQQLRCSDGMSDKTYRYTARFTYQGKLYKGCAELAN